MSVENFLARVEEGRSVSGLTDDELLLAIPFILDELALQWFRQNANSWSTWLNFRSSLVAMYGDTNYQWRLEEQVAARVQGSDERISDFLVCLQSLYLKFQRPVTLSEQMDRAYRNMKPELRRAIRRFEFNDYNSLMTLAKEVERTSVPRGEARIPPNPEESLFPELAYRKKNKSPAPGNSSTKPGKDTAKDSSSTSRQSQDQLASLLAVLIKKLDGKGSFDNRPRQANNLTRSDSDRRKNPTRSNSQKGSSESSQQTKPQPNESRVYKTPKSEPPCFNCKSKDHGWKNCTSRWAKFCHICGKYEQVKQTCNSNYCQGNQ